MAKRKNANATMSDRLRTTIEECGATRYQIAKATGITESSLSRFVVSGRGLSIEALDKLFQYLDLDITPRRRKRS